MAERKLSQLKIGALISYFTMAFNIVAGLIYTPWMVAKIGQSNYGLYTLANSLIAIFMLDFGLSSAVSRFVAKYRAEGRQQDINNIVGIIYKLYLIIDAVILIVLVAVFFFVGDIYKELTPAELQTFKILYVIVAAYQLISFPLMPVDGILNAYEKFSQLKLCNLLYRFLSVFAVVGVLFFSSSVITVIVATVLSHLVTVFAKFIIVQVSVPIKVNFKASGKSIYKKLFSFTAWTTIISIMQRFTHSFAPSVLGITSGALEIGLYAPAVTLEGYFFTLGSAINGMFLPRVSRHIANKEEHKILDLMIKVGRYQAIVLGLAYIGFVCVGQEFMSLWMGPEYNKSYYLAMIILFPTLISATQQIAKTTVIAKKLIKYQAIGMIFTGTLGLLGSYLMSMKVGALGVCLGTALTSIVNILFMNVIYKKKAGINVFVFYKKCYLRLIPCYAVSLVLGFAISHFVNLNGWIGFFVKALLIAIVFLGMVFFIYATKSEKQGIKGAIKKLLK